MSTCVARRFVYLCKLLARFFGTLESSVDDVDTVCLRIGDVLFHEASEAAQIRRDAGHAQHRTFGRCVAPWFVVGWKHTQMATAHELFVVERKQWTR